MSETVMLALLSLLSTLISGIIAYYLRALNIQAEQTARAAEQAVVATEKVATVLAVNTADTTVALNEIRHTGNATHLLVNSAMSRQLKISAIALRRVAELTGHPDDVEAARLAEISYHDHELKQKPLDGKVKDRSKE